MVKCAIEDLLNDRVPFNKLVITKLLKDTYKLAAKREKKSAKKARKIEFTAANVFIDTIVLYKGGKGVVIDKRPDGVTLEVTDESTTRHVSVKYMDILGKGATVIHLPKILNPATDERELEQVTNPHVRLARRMYARDPATAPPSGTRVPFVFCESSTNKLQHEKAEDPSYAQLNGLKVDPIYYLEHQCANAWGQILNTVCPGVVDKIFAEAYDRYSRRGQMQPRLWSVLNGTGREELSSLVLGQTDMVAKPVVKKRKRPKKGAVDPKQLKLKF